MKELRDFTSHAAPLGALRDFHSHAVAGTLLQASGTAVVPALAAELCAALILLVVGLRVLRTRED